MEDWLSVSPKDIRAAGGKGILNHHGTIVKALLALYPEHNWDKKSLTLSRQQDNMFQLLSGIFLQKILTNYRLNTSSVSTTTPSIELDFYLPSVKLAFEYQGDQHFEQTFRGDVQNQMERDNVKRQLCKQLGISLIEIPYWWKSNNAFPKLLASINKQLSE